jgi:hypothetical protein
MSGRISDHIRSNVWGLVACFLAVMGTAVVASASDDGSDATKSGSTTQKIKKLKQRVAALERKPSATIPTSLPPSGPAGGELAGSYPSPTIGTVSGLDLASSLSPAGGINFGPDVNLYRLDPNQLHTNDSLSAGGNITALGNLVVDDTASFSDATVGGFLRLRTVTSAPLATDCDDTPTLERGRVVFNSATNELWVCDPTSGWLQILAS